MGDPVGIGLHLASGTDDPCQSLFFCRSDNHAVLLLYLGGHLDIARLPVFVVTFMTFLLFFIFIMTAGFFFLVPGLLMFSMLAATTLEMGEAIDKTAPQSQCQDNSYYDCLFAHCTPPLRSDATAVSSFTRAV